MEGALLPARVTLAGMPKSESEEAFDLLHIEHPGVILLQASGVLWTNQVGGTACAHPKARGIYVPIGNPELMGVEWLVNRYRERLGDVRVEAMAALRAFGVEEILELRPGLVSEAWVPVRVRRGVPQPWRQFEGCPGIFTYPNSD